MYGMVNKAVEDMVANHHGEATWERIKFKAGVEVDDFISNEGYPDETTHKLVGAASEILALPAEQNLEDFGEHWVLHTATNGCGGLRNAGGDNLREFLLNLPNFHTRAAFVFPELHPPQFECTQAGERLLVLPHRTHRPGLQHFVIGLLQGLGKRFSTPITVQTIQSRTHGADHDAFRVEWPEPAS